MMSDRSSLIEKLKLLGVRPAVELAQTARKDSAVLPIQKAVEGEFVEAGGGEVFVSQQVFKPDHRHGAAAIAVEVPLTILSTWAREERFARLSLEAYAFLDTETSGLAGGTGTYAFLVGVARFIDGEFVLKQFFMRDPAEEAALLDGLTTFLAPCSALVTFNGKAFDAPLLATRYKLHQLPNPMDGYAHLDLLPLARRLWRDRLPSRALKYLEEHILLAPRTSEEVPGYEIPYLYFEYLRTGDASPLKGVFYHNAMDVVTMAALLNHIGKIVQNPFSEDVNEGLDVIALAKFYEDLEEWELAARLFERGLEMNIPEADFWQAVQRLSCLQKRRGNLEKAVQLWERAATKGHVYAHIELAKFHEHQRRDPAAALEWTERARAIISEQDLPRFEYNHWMAELDHRNDRLHKKAKTK